MRFSVFLCVVLAVLSRNLYAEEIVFEVDAILGHDVELPCNTTSEKDGDKLNILAWYANDSSTAFLSRDLRVEDCENCEISSDDPKGRFTLVTDEEEETSNLRIHAVRPSDAGRYRCLVDFAASPSHNTYIQLNVIEPPQRLWVIHENGTRVTTATVGSNASTNIGPYYVGDWVHLFCVAFGGKPLANLTWWSGSSLLKDTSTPLSEQRVRSDLEFGPLRREDHATVLSCAAANNDVTAPVHIDVVIDMYLPPELVSVRDMNASSAGAAMPGRAQTGEVLHLQCRVLGARPTPQVQWRMDNEPVEFEQNLIREPSQRLLISEVRLYLKPSYDEALVTCCAPAYQRDEEAMRCAQAMPLSVLYQPILEIGVRDMSVENRTVTVVKGQDLAINCSYKANPAVYQIMWFHEDDVLMQEDDKDKNSLRPVLNLNNVSEADAGEYVCAGSNDMGNSYSEPLRVDVTYPAYCEDPAIAEYGLGEGESINITCGLKANPEPYIYRWILFDGKFDPKSFKSSQPHTLRETTDDTLQFQRPNGTAFNTIICVGLNGVEGQGPALPHTQCTFLITDETAPRPPAACEAVSGALGEIAVQCTPGHDGGLPQKFKFSVHAGRTGAELLSIVSLEPKFIIQEPKDDNFKFVIVATNDKGESTTVEIDKENIVRDNKDENMSKSAVTNITTLALALCGGVLLVALAACGLVLCAHDRGSRLALPRPPSDRVLCAYNTEESNCETFHESDDSDCNVRRTDSFRRAMSRYPSSKNYDVRRTSSFHSARYMNDLPEPEPKCSDTLRHNAGCRVHSLQNISRKREMEAACDHLIMHLPPDPCYQVAKPMNTFYTMPRKSKNRSTKIIRDDMSEVTQTSDGFSLPPPPDEFGTYRAATRIKDVPTKSTPTYSTIKKSPKQPSRNNKNDVIISPLNTVGLPTISGTQAVYSYPDDDHNQAMLTTTGFFTFKSNTSRKESGI